MLQETRRHLIDILKQHGPLTVDEIVELLHQRAEKKVTAATVRHHLEILKENGIIDTPQVKRRNHPGRPKHLFVLTDKADTYFPTNYANLAEGLLRQIKSTLPDNQINVILEGTAQELASQANIPDNLTIEERLDYVTEHLNSQGYEARWRLPEDSSAEGFILETSNCPYEKVVQQHEDVCVVDVVLISSLLGVVPRRISHKTLNNNSEICAYFIPYSTKEKA